MTRPQIRIGTSGYSYPGPPPVGWSGIFYPEPKGKRFDELQYYARFFNTVEINSTFYRPPSPNTSRAWAKKTPSDFQFSVKAWQKFTHARPVGAQVGETGEKWETPEQKDTDLFRKGIDPLTEAGKLGALLFQYPPGFHYSAGNAERLAWTLSAFKDYPKVIELRHRSWSDRDKATRALLKGLGSDWALIDEPKFASSVRQGFEPIGACFYFRLHGRNAEKWWKHEEPWMRYDYCYSREEIGQFADKIREVLKTFQGSKAYVFFNNHARGQAVVNAIMLSHELEMPIKSAPTPALANAFPVISEILPKPATPQERLF